MDDNLRLDAAEFESKLARPQIAPGLNTLLHANVDKLAGAIIKMQMVTTTGDTLHTTAM